MKLYTLGPVPLRTESHPSLIYTAVCVHIRTSSAHGNGCVSILISVTFVY